MERAPGRPSTQTSTVKPSGRLSLSTGSSFADFPVTSIANGCRVDFSCSVLRPCCQEGGAAGAAGACACAATAVSAQASVQVKEMSQRNGAEYMEYPPFAGCCCLRGGATVQSTGRSGIIATLDPGRNRTKKGSRAPVFGATQKQPMAHRITASCPAALLALGAGTFTVPAGAQTGSAQGESSG